MITTDGMEVHGVEQSGRSPGQLEKELLEAWSGVLDRPLEPTEDIFDIGADSLQAAQAFSRFEARTGIHAPLGLLLSHQTIHGLAQEIARAQSCPATERSSPLVPIRPTGTEPPLFCFHAGHANVLFYRSLSEYLDPAIPIYALQAIGLDGKEEPYDRMEPMAARYAEAIRQIQPSGPYRMITMCFSNTLGCELIKQFELVGESVSEFIVLDSGPRLPRNGTAAPTGGPRIRNYLTAAYPANWSRSYERVRYKVKSAPKRFRRWRLNRFGTDYDKNFGRILAGFRAALQIYMTPTDIPKVRLIRTTEYANRTDKRHVEAWNQVAQTVDVHLVSGRHRKILEEPTVREVADILNEAMGKLKASTPRRISTEI